MKFLVCISKTPDTTTKIAFTDNDTRFNTAGVQYILNPYDEWYALVRACELKEKVGGTVTVINVGEADNEQIIRKALAIGADDAIRIDSLAHNAYFVAKQIAAHASGYDIVFLGKETIDYNGSEVGSTLAELLDLPFVSYGTSLELDGTTATITREIEGGSETVSVATPFVVSAAKGMAEQRIPNMQGIMKARSKPLVVAPPVEVAELVSIVNYTMPPAKTGVKMIAADNVAELVRLLHEEAKVI
jgi:electron transfer flavoprotein beta subunit